MPLDATTTTPKPLRVRSLAELLAEQFPRRDHLLHPVLRQGESMLLWAPPGVGKTMLLLSTALAVAGGGTFLGWTAERPWRVLLVDGEMAIEDLQDRLRMLAPTVEGFDAEVAGENLAVLARQDQRADTGFPDIASAEGQEVVMREIRRHRADLVLLDNFSTLAEVADENEAGAMNPVLAFLLRLKQARVGCILVHHSGKTGQTYRGSSKLATTFEVILGLKPPEVSGRATGAAFTTEWSKFRGAPHATLTPRDVVLTRATDGTLRWDAKPAEGDDAGRFVEAIKSGRFGSQNEIAEAFGWDKSKVSRIKTRVIASGDMTQHRINEAFAASREGHEEEGPPAF